MDKKAKHGTGTEAYLGGRYAKDPDWAKRSVTGNENLDIAVFVNPITGRVELMPVAMIGAYVPHADHLHLEEAAKVAAIRDDEAATNLMLSMDTEYPTFALGDATGFDILAVEAPSLR